MRKIFTIVCVVIVATMVSCEKKGCTDFEAANYTPDADVDDGSCFYNGQYVFWTDADYQVGYIDVKVDDVLQGTIDSYLSSGLPKCGDKGFVTFEAAPGTYGFTATSHDGTKRWEGTINVEERQCKTMLLYVANSKLCCKEVFVVGDSKGLSDNALPLHSN